MALQTPFFSKRDSEPLNPRAGVSASGYGGGTVTSASAHAPAASQALTGTSPTIAPVAAASAPREGGSKLTVGPNIKLKGVEITDCDTLFVEGLVEATMDSRLMQISEQGAFKGSAEIDIAEIHGKFDGDLTVRQ